MGLYEQYPILKRVKSILNSVENTEKSTGNAQYRILKTSQKPNKFGGSRFGPWMDTFSGWAQLKNDPRLNPAQKKTINKILVSLKVPARDQWRNRPRLDFNISGKTVAQVNDEVRKRSPLVRMYNNPIFNNKSTRGFKKYNNPVAEQPRFRTTYGMF